MSLRHHITAASTVALLLMTAAVLSAQIGGGPRFPGPLPVPDPSGGRVPTRRAPEPTYPGGGGDVNLPGRAPVPAPDLPPYTGTQTHYGKVDKVEEKELVIIAGDKRIISFALFDSTEFWRKDEQVKWSDVHEGDTVRVEADQSDKGYLTAVRIYIDEPAEVTEAQPLEQEAEPEPDKPDDRPTIRTGVDTWDYSKPPSQEHIPVDESDPGPPVLRRTSAEEAERIEQERTAKIAEPPPQSAPVATEEGETFEIADDATKPDPLIERARATAEAFTAGLPNFICRQLVTRFESNTKPADWMPLDLVETELAYEDGMESYQAIKVNGKLLKKQEMAELDGGSWSKGEFGTVLRNLFEPWTLAEFKFRKNDTSTRPKTKVYWFHVEQSRSNWAAHIASVSYLPEYRGAVWIDEETARVVRIEMEALNLPVSLPIDTLELNIDYGLVRIGGQEYLLPTHSENLACMRGDLRCNWNKIDFRNYRRFSAESTLFEAEAEITFDNQEVPPAEQEPEPE